MSEPQQQMIIQDEYELDERLHELMRHDATVLNGYRNGELLGMSKTKLYLNLVLLLAAEKKAYFDMAVDATNRAMPDPLKSGRL